MSDAIDALIKNLSTARGSENRGSFVDRLGQVVLMDGAKRLADRLDHIASGDFETAEINDIATLIRWSARQAEQPAWSLSIAEPLLSELPEPIRDGTLRLLLELFSAGSEPLFGQARIVSTSILKIVENPLLLRLSLQGTLCGLHVRIVTPENLAGERPIEVILSGPLGGLSVCAGGNGLPSSSVWSVAAWSGQRPSKPKLPELVDTPAREVSVSLPKIGERIVSDRSEEAMSLPETSVVDLFGDFICLRDLQPRSQLVRGLDALRSPLKLAAPVVPRKSEPDYARVVRSFVDDVAGPHAQMIYVGDTVFNDGSVICNLDAREPGSVFGFLCNEKGFAGVDDFILGPIYFAKQWRSLGNFVRECKNRGITIGAHTVGLFDLDQTVYAAKGRDDGSLHQARWEAIQAFLRDTIPAYKFDAERAERIYRQFDTDEYHRITRDNMDYVVLLVLAVAAGLCDAREIEAFAASPDNSISSLTELLHSRALARQGHEKIEGVLEVIRAVYYNTLAGDQTPCKDFRRYECRSTALRMRAGSEKERGSRILLNREVVDFIQFLRARNAQVFAVSDRPVEAAVIDDSIEGAAEDLMSIPMEVIGFPISDALKAAG